MAIELATGEERSTNVVRTLDFLVIGAAKSGTTTLFHYLNRHPRIAMPANKEAPFFSLDDVFGRGWACYSDDHFAGAPRDAVWGKITPRYLGDLEVPERLHALMPDVRLVALLRNPIDRAFSKYRLLVREEGEPRSFDQIVDEQLAPDAIDRARHESVPIDDALVARGEYARLLGDYLHHFTRDRLRLYLTDEFETNPQAVLDDLMAFLGLPAGFTPSNLGKHYFVGGNRQRFPTLVPRLRRLAPLRALWRAVPPRYRRSFHLWFSNEFNVVREPPATMAPEVRQRLAAFYEPDVRRLESLLGRPVPWADWRADAP